MVSKAALAIPIAVGAAGVSLYAYLTYQRRNKKTDDEIPVKGWTEHRMVLNKAYAHLVLGQLDFIRQMTKTLINVLKISDEDETFSVVMKGTEESVQEAEFMVNRLIENSPEITTSMMEVPKEKIKLIVGDFGNRLLKISQETGSKIFLKCDPDFYEASVLNDPDVVSKLSNDYFPVSPFYIEIKGPREKNALAYELIRQTLGQDPSATPHSTWWDDFPKESPLEIINASQNSKYVEVTMSSIASINKFYVQLYSLSSALVKMERRITDHFNFNRGPWTQVNKIKIGAMVAVPYMNQDKWHRAVIVGIDEKNVATSTVRAMFVDYGDSQNVKVDEIRALPLECTSYPYFAVECSLAGVLSKTSKLEGEEEWSDESLDFFESLTSDRPNKILMARKYGDYEIVSRNAVSRNGRNRRHKIPAIELVDTTTSEDIHIAIELISKGYACSSIRSDSSMQPSQVQPIKCIGVPEYDTEDEEEFELN